MNDASRPSAVRRLFPAEPHPDEAGAVFFNRVPAEIDKLKRNKQYD